MDVEVVPRLQQEVFMEPRPSPLDDSRRVAGGRPAVGDHAHVGTAALQPDIRLALDVHRLVERTVEPEVPFVADFVVVDPRAVSGGQPLAELLERAGYHSPMRPDPPVRVRAVLRLRRPLRNAVDDRVHRNAVRFKCIHQLVHAVELPAVRPAVLD